MSTIGIVDTMIRTKDHFYLCLEIAARRPWPDAYFSQTESAGAFRPVYRGYDPKTDDHFYAIDRGEIDLLPNAYRFEGIAFYVLDQPSNGNRPELNWSEFHRLLDPSGTGRFYTADPVEYASVKAAGFTDEGSLGFVFFPTPQVPFPSSIGPLYEAYNPNSGSHFYTMDFAERNNATKNLGMRASGINCYIYHDGMQPAINTVPLLRAYNAALDVHLYTVNSTELNEAQLLLGYQPEKTHAWVWLNPVGPDTALLHRLYGDFADNFLVESPALGLASYSNYIMNNVVGGSCQAIQGLSVEIDVLEDIVSSSVNFGAKGFAFQLNCESISPCGSPDSGKTGWQQYVITLWGPSLIGIVNNWINNSSTYSLVQYDGLLTLPKFTLQKGFKLTIELVYDQNANVVGVIYSAFNPKGKRVAHRKRMISSVPNAKYLGVAPIGSFQLVLVGPISGADSTLSSGSGTFTYNSSTPIRPGTAFPGCVAGATTTAESANSVYGLMPDQRDREFVQDFSVSTPAPNPSHYKKWFAGVKVGPPLQPPPDAQRQQEGHEKRKPAKLAKPRARQRRS